MTKLRKVLEDNVRVLTVTANEDLAEGVLFAVIKEDGVNKAVLASNVIAKGASPVKLKAVGIVDKTSTETWGEAFNFNPVAKLDKDDHIDVLTHAYIVAEEVPEDAKLGDEAWLGEDGKFVFEAPVAVEADVDTDGVLVQKVGVVRNVERQIVEVTL